jgi:hypothetical protein
MEYVITGLLSIGVVVLGAIWARIGKLEDAFVAFGRDCRIRHESVAYDTDIRRTEDEIDVLKTSSDVVARDIIAIKEKLAYMNGASVR